MFAVLTFGGMTSPAFSQLVSAEQLISLIKLVLHSSLIKLVSNVVLSAFAFNIVPSANGGEAFTENSSGVFNTLFGDELLTQSGSSSLNSESIRNCPSIK
uniref:Uncharacterized protein n=1 Tax=Panstrongylus lignarius TaxID=156445 RepID=A0A224XQV3_9HEMI